MAHKIVYYTKAHMPFCSLDKQKTYMRNLFISRFKKTSSPK